MLPKCKHRGEILENGQYECACPMVKNTSVPAVACRNCDHCDNPEELVQIKKIMSDVDKYKNPKNLGPSVIQMGWNLTKAIAMHVKDGMSKVSTKEYEERLKICDDCPLRDKNRCTHMKCGCKLNLKARWKSEKCPDGKWPELDSDGV